MKTKYNFKTLLLFFGAILFLQNSSAQNTATYNFTSAGATQTFTVPAGVTSLTIEAWGGGGRGASIVSATGRGGGGGAGGYSKHVMTVTPGTSYNIVVGGGSTTTASGGNTTFNSTTVVANGGLSAGDNVNNGVAGGAASGGSLFNRAGGAGANGQSGSYGGGGGASGSTNGNGVAATNASGATAPSGGGNGGAGRSTTTGTGLPGTIPGGGGGGAFRTTSGTSAGGSGANGQLLITYGIAEINVFSAYGTNLVDGDNTPTASEGNLFGSVNTGSALTSEFIIMNTGNVALTLGTPTFSGTNASEFTVLTSPGTSIAAGSTATMVIRFLPTGTGTRTAAISFSTNDADENPFNFSLQGTGTAPVIAVTGGPSVPTTIPNNMVVASATVANGCDYGTQITTGSITRTYTITNTGTGLLTITGVSLTGGNAGDFAVAVSPASTVAVGASTTFSIRFDPSTGSTRTTTVNIASDAGTFKFDIKGTYSASTAADVSVYSSGSVEIPLYAAASTGYNTDFGSLNTLDTPITKTYTIKNDSATLLQNLTGVTVAVSGTGFSVSSSTIPISPLNLIGPSGSATFTIQFDPTTVGTVTGMVTVTTSDANEGSYTFYITGTGTNPEIAVTGGNPAANITDNAAASSTTGTDFGQQFTVGYITREFTITNSGTGPLTIGSVNVANTSTTQTTNIDYAVSGIGAGTSIAAGTSLTFTITYDPAATSAGTRTATITINCNDTDESAFDIRVTGTVGTSSREINVQGGSPLVDINMFDYPTIAQGTNFGGIYVTNGTIAKSFTIQNTGGGATLTISSVTITGTNASDFTLTTAPSYTALPTTTGSTTMTITFNPSGTGTRSAIVTINNNDANEGTYVFYIQGDGNTYADSDFDSVTDDNDVDDDNDGILDTMEQSACALLTTSTTTSKVFLNETFGTGTARTTIDANNADAGTTYTYGTTSLDDGQYTVFNSAQITTWASEYWYRGADHTGDTNGKMAMFNANFTPEKFYTNTISGVTPNVEVTFSFYAINLDRSDATDVANRIRPNVRVEIRKVSDNTLITSLSTGNIPPSPSGTATASDWTRYPLTFTTSETEFKVTFINNAPGGLGNDIAIDDITVSQKYCDMDHDDEADMFDLDDDNDGIPDSVEAGFKAYTNNKSRIDTADNTKWVDVNKNGLNDNIDPDYISNYYTSFVQDTDGDGIYDFMDYDSDNDTKFDIDEAQADTFYLNNTGGAYTGDGDIDGDGKGDGVDTDGDGLLDLNDDSSSYGTTFKAFPTDTDGDGTPDYLDLTSNGSAKDIAGTLYAGLDSNNDGKVDGTADVDKDGILDAFDSYNIVSTGSTVSIGSPRDIVDKSLLIDFDGRNDYAEGDQLLSGLSKATIMGWIKLDTYYPSTPTIVLGQDNFYITITGSATRNVSVVAGSYSAAWTTALDLNRWYHIAAIYDSAGTLKLYVNGTLRQTTAVTGSLGATSTKFTMAKKSSASTNYFRGYIDEVRVFNTAITEDQLQKMIYQKISQNGTAIRGAIIPKNIESSTWSNLKAYYRLDDYKGNVTDDFTISGTDNGTSSTFCKIYNVKYIKTENTPLPFKTRQAGILDSSALTDATNFIYGPDIKDNNYSIVQVKHDVTVANNFTSVGLIVDAGKKITVNNDNKIENSWYLDLQGTIDLTGKSQLVQGLNSDLASTTTGSIERDQQGTKIKYNYNYWSSPVSTISSSTVNNGYTIAGVMKDGTATTPANISWTDSQDAPGNTTPITLSRAWVYKYQNLGIAYANWSYVGENGSLSAGQGYTLKGSNASTSNQNYVFVGKPNNGTITSPISASNLNLSGNPYPSAISASEFIKDNLPASSPSANPGTSGALTGPLYFWEHSSTNNSHVYASYIGGYGVYSLVGGVAPLNAATGTSGQVGAANTPPGDYIPVGQGFFVQGSTTGGNITFKNSQRAFVKENASNSNSLLRNANSTQSGDEPYNNENTPLVNNGDNFIKIRLGFNNNVDAHRQVLIGFMNEYATDGIDLGYDALNFDSNPSDMYFKTPDGNLIVQGVGSFTNTAIYPLGVTADTASPVSFTLDGVENLPENQNVFIFDALDSSYHNIKDGDFETTLDAGTYNERFSLRFMNPLSTNNPVVEDKINVAYTNGDQILTIRNNALNTVVESAMLFNILGQQIAAWNIENENQQNIQFPIKGYSAGTYIVKVKTSTGSLAKKIIIR
ncbi:choice-of-anchor D domain-containing protein [Flavobacterium sp.]|uniref:choice-of-anchor D domain-containing protein n=1 Tax=Flavobacterium sp. TaxID=239 RepID=UPI002624BAC3|nr:choice-of-anchor D domain-containing protein [Flavobacterium sp.]